MLLLPAVHSAPLAWSSSETTDAHAYPMRVARCQAVSLRATIGNSTNHWRYPNASASSPSIHHVGGKGIPSIATGKSRVTLVTGAARRPAGNEMSAIPTLGNTASCPPAVSNTKSSAASVNHAHRMTRAPFIDCRFFIVGYRSASQRDVEPAGPRKTCFLRILAEHSRALSLRLAGQWNSRLRDRR